MEKKEYYLDSCIWLNLFKKEGDSTKGVPFWKLAKDFIDQAGNDEGMVIVSTIVLKELYFVLGEKFGNVKQFFKEASFVSLVKTTNDDYNLARKLERQHQFLSFYDYLHVAIARRLNVPLITRDNALIEFAKSHVEVFKPEDLLR